MPVVSLRRRIISCTLRRVIPSYPPPLRREPMNKHGRVRVVGTDVGDVLPQYPTQLHARRIERHDAVLGPLPLPHAQVGALGPVHDVVHAQRAQPLESPPCPQQQLHDQPVARCPRGGEHPPLLLHREHLGLAHRLLRRLHRADFGRGPVAAADAEAREVLPDAVKGVGERRADAGVEQLGLQALQRLGGELPRDAMPWSRRNVSARAPVRCHA